MEEFIVTEKLTKKYDKMTAIQDLDLRVHRGEIFGFLGPNGAGKTTTIRILTTLTKSTSGFASVGGFDVAKESDKVKQVMGVVQQHLSLDRDLTVRENMEFHARLHHMGSSERKQRIVELLDYVDLIEYADIMVERLSGGMKKKASIVCSLLHQPTVLFLDEPTVGLDAQARRRLWDLVRRLNLDGTTIFLTTHYIEEAEALCGRVGIMHFGSLIDLGTPLELRKRLGSIATETHEDNKPTRYQFFASREEATCSAQNLSSSKTLIIRETNLEDVFVELTGEKAGGD